MIKQSDIFYIAKLAKLEINESNIEEYQVQFGQILEYIQQLEELETLNIEPISHAIELFNVYREDHCEHTLSSRDVFQNAIEQEETFFKVPRILAE